MGLVVSLMYVVANDTDHRGKLTLYPLNGGTTDCNDTIIINVVDCTHCLYTKL